MTPLTLNPPPLPGAPNFTLREFADHATGRVRIVPSLPVVAQRLRDALNAERLRQLGEIAAPDVDDLLALPLVPDVDVANELATKYDLRAPDSLPLIITSACRTPWAHVRVYKWPAGVNTNPDPDWLGKLTLDSRHLIAALDSDDLVTDNLPHAEWDELAIRVETARVAGRVRPSPVCDALDVRRPHHIALTKLTELALRLGEMAGHATWVRPYPWGVHLDLRHWPSTGWVELRVDVKGDSVP